MLTPARIEGVGDGLFAGAVAGLLSGAPSTVHALVSGRDPLQAVHAAGTLVLAPDTAPRWLLVVGTAVHTLVSLGWATLFALVLPRRHTTSAALVAGMAVAGFDLGVVGRRYPRIRAMPAASQVADHLAFGALVGIVVTRRRRSRLRPVR
ncbi:MAG: hypothetical protein ACR2G7_01250 [Acidimicrobiales bacterium]